MTTSHSDTQTEEVEEHLFVPANLELDDKGLDVCPGLGRAVHLRHPRARTFVSRFGQLEGLLLGLKQDRALVAGVFELELGVLHSVDVAPAIGRGLGVLEGHGHRAS